MNIGTKERPKEVTIEQCELSALIDILSKDNDWIVPINDKTSAFNKLLKIPGLFVMNPDELPYDLTEVIQMSPRITE